jgi:hypothetical protein
MNPLQKKGRVVAIVRPRIADLATAAIEQRLPVKDIIRVANQHVLIGLAGEDGESILNEETLDVVGKRTPDDIEVDWVTLQDVMETQRGNRG